MIPNAVYSVSNAELNATPPELRTYRNSGSAATLNIGGVMWEGSQNRHSIVMAATVQVTITSPTNQTAIIGVRIALADLQFQFVSDIWQSRSFTAQPLVDEHSGAAVANSTFVAAFSWNLDHHIMVPAGHSLMVYSIGWTNGGLPSSHSFVSSVLTLGIPTGSIVR